MISEKLKFNNKISESGFLLEPDYNNRTLDIDITTKCNEKCIYCQYAQSGITCNGSDIDEELFYRVTREARELGITDIGLYMTGEPFLNQNLNKYIGWCKQLGFSYIYLSTNGILCDKNALYSSVDAGLDSIKFSIAGANRDSFKSHHGVDAFDIVVRNVKDAFELRKSNQLDFKIYMFVVVTEYNKHEREEFKQLFSDYVDEIIFSNCIDSSIPMIGLQEKIAPVKQGGGYLDGVGRKLPCVQLFNRIVVDQAGWLCICCCGCFEKKYIRVVDLNQFSLKDAVYSSLMKKIRKNHLQGTIENTICESCVTGVFNNRIVPYVSDLDNGIKTEQININDEISKRFNC